MSYNPILGSMNNPLNMNSMTSTMNNSNFNLRPPITCITFPYSRTI